MKNILLAALMVFTTAITFAQPCSNLFISEYVEGSSYNKAYEIYNPTSSTVDMSTYQIIVRGYSSTGTTPFYDTLTLDGSLSAGGTYVISHTQADASILAIADTTNDDVCNFNGNDAIGLFDLTLGQMIDAVGDYAGANIGSGGWPVDTGYMRENTLVRMPSVNQGTTSWANGETQWIVYPRDDLSHMGAHTMTPCAAVVDTVVSFAPATTAAVAEESGTYSLNLQLNQASNPATFSVDVELISGDATQIDNFATQTVTFSATSNETVTITITDDAIQETADTFEFRLTNATGNLLIGADSIFTFIINESDQPLTLDPLYTIATIRGNDTDGEPDSIGVECRIVGVVLGPNFSPNGLSFTVHDGTAGIGVFAPSSASNFGYTVSEGDSIMLQGEVDAYNGLGQMSYLDTIILLGTGTVPTPTEVTDLDESTESELVVVRGLTVVSTVSSTSAGVTYEVTNGINNFDLRLDADISFNSLPNRFDAIGIGGQYSFSSPYVADYQLSPRKDSDITSVSSIKELTADQVSVFPNPTTGKVVIALNSVELNKVTINDLSGRVVFSTELTSSRQTLDISGLSNGMYLLQATGEGLVYNTRIVKNN